MKNRKYLSILALVGALMLVAAACGDDDGGETGGTGRHARHGRGRRLRGRRVRLRGDRRG